MDRSLSSVGFRFCVEPAKWLPDLRLVAQVAGFNSRSTPDDARSRVLAHQPADNWPTLRSVLAQCLGREFDEGNNQDATRDNYAVDGDTVG